jgi:hypothetical protein
LNVNLFHKLYKMFLKIIATCCILIFALAKTTIAQTKPTKPAVQPAAQKFKPPKLFTSLGSKTDTIVTVSINEAIALINQPLKATDNDKGFYIVSSYQCLYKKRGVTEDEQTGKISPTSSVVVQRFTTTPLSEIWRKTIAEDLKVGEEISFFDIVVKDNRGRLMFAPKIKLIVK